MIGQSRFYPRRRQRGQALAHLGKPLFCPSLRSQCPTSEDSSSRQEESEPLLVRERNRRLGVLLGRLRLTAELMDSSRKTQGGSQAQRMRELVSQAQRCADSLHGLVWIAQKPQNKSRKKEQRHPGLGSMHKGHGAVLLGIIEGKP